MDDWDPIVRYQYEAADVFAHAPAEFELTPWKLGLGDPCWVHADIILAPRTPATREKFFAKLSLPHRWDAFARVSWEDQLEDAFSPRSHRLRVPMRMIGCAICLDCSAGIEEALPHSHVAVPRAVPVRRASGVCDGGSSHSFEGTPVENP